MYGPRLCLLLSLLIAAPGFAAPPDGSGGLALDLSWEQPGVSVKASELEEMTRQLRADRPLSLKVRLLEQLAHYVEARRLPFPLGLEPGARDALFKLAFTTRALGAQSEYNELRDQADLAFGKIVGELLKLEKGAGTRAQAARLFLADLKLAEDAVLAELRARKTDAARSALTRWRLYDWPLAPWCEFMLRPAGR